MSRNSGMRGRTHDGLCCRYVITYTKKRRPTSMGGHSPCYPRCFRATSSFCSTTVHAGSRARYNGQRTAACHGRGRVCMRRKKGCRPPHTFCAAGTTAACAPEGRRKRDLARRCGIHAKNPLPHDTARGRFILWRRRRDLNPQPADYESKKWLFPGISRCFPIACFCPVSSKETEGYLGFPYSLTFPCPPAASRKKWGQNGDNFSGAHTMGYQWHQLEEGIRVREHPTRKHGSKRTHSWYGLRPYSCGGESAFVSFFLQCVLLSSKTIHGAVWHVR